MKVDLYTKVILTGIFACLCLVLLRDVRFEKTAEAQGIAAATPVVITGCTNGVGGPAGTVPVSITGCFKGLNGRSIPLPVNIRLPVPLPVNIHGTGGNVPVEIRSSRQLPVNVQNWPR